MTTVKKRNKHKEEEDINAGDYFRPFNLYAILACGCISIAAGIYLYISEKTAYGNLGTNRYSGRPGHNVSITGTGAILLGIIIAIYPLYLLITKTNKKTPAHENKINQPAGE